MIRECLRCVETSTSRFRDISTDLTPSTFSNARVLIIISAREFSLQRTYFIPGSWILRNRAASSIILRISLMLTFLVTTSGYISSPESASVPRESAKEIVISFLDSLNSLLPVIRQLTMGLPILLSSFVGVSIMVLLMMYVIIPLLTKLLTPWLTKKRLF